MLETYQGIIGSDRYPNQLSFYFPDIYCSNGSPTSCSNPNKLFIIGLGTTKYQRGLTDNLYKYVCKQGSNYCDLSNASSWVWEKEYIAFNADKNNYCNSNLDQYAEPSYVYANGKHFLFFTNPNGDNDFARGRIAFRYSTNGINWSSDNVLLEIADENIKNCNCTGGFARPTVIFRNGYFYIYFEVWRDRAIVTDPLEYRCCPPNYVCNGWQQQFLAKFTYKNEAPYISFDSGSAQIYKKSTNQWINLGCKRLSPTPGTLPPPSILCDSFIFGWTQSYDIRYCPSANGYTYPNGELLNFENDTLFPKKANDSLGDVSLTESGGCLAIFHTFKDATDSIYEEQILTMESIDCINFQEPYILMNWEALGLEKSQLANTGPSVFPWGSTYNNKNYLMAYSVVPVPSQWHQAYVKMAKIVKYLKPKPQPKPSPINFIKLRLINNLSYYDSNNDGILDNEIILPIDSSYETIINSLQPFAYEEKGFFRVKAYYAYCYYKNKNKIKCVVDDDEDIPGIGLDEDQNIIYFRKGLFEAGDELELQLILRAYDEEKPKDKQKKCKKDDTCIDIKIKFEHQ